MSVAPLKRCYLCTGKTRKGYCDKCAKRIEEAGMVIAEKFEPPVPPVKILDEPTEGWAFWEKPLL